MRIVFFGTPDFAADILEALVASSHQIVAVISRPDRPQKRSSKLIPSAVKQMAARLLPNTPIHQPERASAPDFASVLEGYQADLFVVVAFSEIIRDNLLSMPKYGCINVHPSLLPKYRGAAPIQRALMAGESQTGTSIMYMVRKMDAGDILAQEALSVGPNETYGELAPRLCQLSASALLDVLSKLESGVQLARTQDESKVSFANKILPEDCQLDYSRSAKAVHDQVRALSPSPGVYCTVCVNNRNRRLKVYKAELIRDASIPEGVVVNGLLGCSSGALKLIEVQLEGKRRMSATDLFKGIGKGPFQLVS